MKLQSLIPSPQSLAVILAFCAVSAFSGPVSHFGMLKACKVSNQGRLCGEKTGTSTAIQVVGPSFYWSSGDGSVLYGEETVDWFVDNMQIGIVRAAMGIRYFGNNTNELTNPPRGYYYDASTQKAMIKKIVDAAIVNDIYVIVDWHSHNAETEQSSAVAFFGEMAREYKDVPNIIWEVYNEPMGTGAQQIDSYAKAVHKAIRDAGSKNLVIIGSGSWSQNPNSQASQYGSSDKAVTDNVAFVLHFYSASHSVNGEGASATSAMGNGFAVMVSEWGFTNADGGGSVNDASAWRTWMDNNKISNCNWSITNLNEASAMFTTSTTSSTLSTGNLTQSGRNFQSYMNSNKWTSQIPSGNPKGNDVSVSVRDGESVTITSTQLGLTGNISEVNQPEIGSATNTTNSITYTTSPSGSEKDKIRFTYKVTQGSATIQQRVTVTITNRKPILPPKNPITVSRRAPKVLRAVADFSAIDPNDSKAKLSFSAASLSDDAIGTVTIIGADKDSLLFTPKESQYNVEYAEVTLNYTIKNPSNVSSSASVLLKLQNNAPTINTATVNNCCAGIMQNTDPVKLISMAQTSGVGGNDLDGDSLWFRAYYLDPRYPGRLELIAPDTLAYYPVAGRTGTVVILSVISDGILESPTGRTVLRIQGNGGTAIDNITNSLPSEMPSEGYIEITPIVSHTVAGNGFGMKALGFGRVELNLAQSGIAKLDVYSLSGKNLGTLLSGHQSAGSKEVSLSSLNLQKGVYILRLKQGSQVKTLRITN